MAKSLTPTPKFTVYLNGVPANGAKVYTYEGGSVSTPIATYSDYDGTLNANPVICDSRGECDLWLTPGVSYKFVVKTSADVTIYTVDDVIGPDDSGGSGTFTSITITGNGSVFSGTVTFNGATNFNTDTTISLTTGEAFTVTGTGTTIIETDLTVSGDATFTGDVDMSDADSVDYLDGSVQFDDLSVDLQNLILSSGGSAGGGAGIASGDGRLSLASGVRNMVANYSAITTIYYVGGLILTLNSGSGAFSAYTIGELSQTLADTNYSPAASAANKLYDIFGWKRSIVVASITRSGTTATVTTTGNHNITTDAVVFISGATQAAYNGYHTLTSGSGTTFTFEVAGSPATPATGTILCSTGQISRGPFWSSDTARGTGAGTTELELIGNTYVNKVDITNGPTAQMGTYLGTIMTDGSNQLKWHHGAAAAGGTEAWLSVYNVSNQLRIGTVVQDSTVSWSKSTTTIEPSNGSSTMRATFVRGLDDNSVRVYFQGQASPGTSTNAAIGIGIDSTSALATGQSACSTGQDASLSLADTTNPMLSNYNSTPGLGKHYIQCLQFLTIANTSTYYSGSTYGHGLFCDFIM